MLTKFDLYGDTVWTKTLKSKPNTAFSATDAGKGMNLTLDSSLLVTGIRILDTVSGIYDSAVCFAAKYTLLGDSIWYQEYGDAGDTWMQIKSTLLCDDGTFIHVGNTDIPSGGGYQDVFILKTDSAGNEIWRQYYGGLYNDDAFEIVQCPSGGYYICGVYHDSSPTDDIDMFVLKISSIGTQEWLKFFGSIYDDGTCSINVLSDSNVLLIGAVGNSGAVTPDSFISKLYPTGDTIWTNKFDRNGETDLLYGTKPIETNDGGYIISGVFYDSTMNDGLNAWLLKSNSSGDIQWERSWSQFGGINHNYFWDMIRTSDNGILLAGWVTNFFAPTDSYSWLVKLDSNGCDSIGCPTSWVNAIEELSIPDIDFKIYPNPSTGIVNFQFSESYENGELLVFDMIGNLVFQQSENSEYFTLDFSSFKKGMYLIKMVAEDRKVSIRKLIID
ncbi:MAG: hypothetical protein ACI9J3_003323 [Parvicellaceae bacterium]|jgi:hypothetical protein